MHSAPFVRHARTSCGLKPALTASLILLCLSSLPASAQTKPAAPDRNADEDTLLLSPFEVRADSSTSYGALESNSLTAFRIDLRKMPATAQVFTRTFIDDIGATSIEDVLTGYAGTVTASSNNANAALWAPGDRDGSQGLSIRGVSAGEIKRDGFIGPPNNARTASGSTDNFSIDRVEVIEGPQSILYGSVGGGGVVNTASKRAIFNKSSGSLKFTFDDYSSKRAVADYNYGLEKIAARVALVTDDSRSMRYRLGSNLTGIYAQLAFRLTDSTTLRLYTEKTDTEAIVGFKPNLNNFLSATDARRNRDSRYLVLTNQVSDLKILNQPLTYENLESLGSWWSAENIKTHWNGMTLEQRLPWGFSAQLTAIYTETEDLRVTDGRSLLPARGLPNAGANPFDVTAVQIGSPVRDNEQRDRNKGARLSVLHEADFTLFGVKAHSQTGFGGQAFHRGPTFGSSGIAHAYYQADANWNVITNPALTVDYGRVPLQFLYFPVQDGVPDRPIFRPGSSRVTVNGINYVRQPRILTDPKLKSPTNPYGLIPNNPTATNPNGYTDNWNRGGETHSGSIYGANFTDWFDGKLTTLAGYSLTRFETFNVGPGSITLTPKEVHPGWQVGANYGWAPWIRFYAVAGTAEQAEASTTDIYGLPLKNPEANSPTPEFGIKLSTPDGRYSAQLNYSPETKTLNENKNTGDTSFRDAINPDGINGRVGGSGANQRVNLDRTLESASLVITADPTRNWRMRLLISRLDGEISRSVVYQQVYNDQFYLNNGVVSYRDGTPVMVDPTGGVGARTTALTLAMLNTPTNPYYAAPDPTSGRISNSTLRTVLMSVDPGRGSAATGVVGLPLTAIQYNFTSPYPNGTVTIYQEGEKNTGFNEYTYNIQSNYKFSSGPLKGLSLFGDLQGYMKNRAYYTTTPGSNGSLLGTRVTRTLYRLPDNTVFNMGVSYSFKLGQRYTWTSQLNVRNVFDQSKVWVVPTSANSTVLNARLSNQPRTFVWSNTLAF